MCFAGLSAAGEWDVSAWTERASASANVFQICWGWPVLCASWASWSRLFQHFESIAARHRARFVMKGRWCEAALTDDIDRCRASREDGTRELHSIGHCVAHMVPWDTQRNRTSAPSPARLQLTNRGIASSGTPLEPCLCTAKRQKCHSCSVTSGGTLQAGA